MLAPERRRTEKVRTETITRETQLREVEERASVAAFFEKKTAETATDEELQAVLDEIEALEGLGSESGDAVES
jgi:hypothetical protein